MSELATSSGLDPAPPPMTERPCMGDPNGRSTVSACTYVSLYMSQNAIGCRWRENSGKVDDEHA
jgi:hypothetical protein